LRPAIDLSRAFNLPGTKHFFFVVSYAKPFGLRLNPHEVLVWGTIGAAGGGAL
jgi:hypothetical protein